MMITGDVESRSVYIDGEELDPKLSQRLVNHSPDGFMWGYGGSGPSQLALALMVHFCTSHAEAMRFYQDFKKDYVAQWDKDRDFQIDSDHIEAWLTGRRDGR